MAGDKIHAPGAGGGDVADNWSADFWVLYGAVNPGDIVVTPPLGDGNDTLKLLVDGVAAGAMSPWFFPANVIQ